MIDQDSFVKCRSDPVELAREEEDYSGDLERPEKVLFSPKSVPWRYRILVQCSIAALALWLVISLLCFEINRQTFTAVPTFGLESHLKVFLFLHLLFVFSL